MFGSKKGLKQIEEARKQLEEEKKELLFIKEQLEDSSPKVDVSNIFVWEDKGVYSIVKLDVQLIHGRVVLFRQYIARTLSLHINNYTIVYNFYISAQIFSYFFLYNLIVNRKIKEEN